MCRNWHIFFSILDLPTHEGSPETTKMWVGRDSNPACRQADRNLIVACTWVGGDSNSQGLLHMVLSHARIPIPPPTRTPKSYPTESMSSRVFCSPSLTKFRD